MPVDGVSALDSALVLFRESSHVLKLKIIQMAQQKNIPYNYLFGGNIDETQQKFLKWKYDQMYISPQQSFGNQSARLHEH